MIREARIRATNLLFIFWDVFYPLGYLLVFGVGIDHALRLHRPCRRLDYNAFFLAGVLGMASFGIASNTAWSFFLDRDNGIFYEMLTYPLSRSQYLLGKVLFNVIVALVQAAITIVSRPGAARRADPVGTSSRCSSLVVVVGTAGWFFFYAIFALSHPPQRRVQHGHIGLLFRLPVRELDVLSARAAARMRSAPSRYANPITWQVDLLRYGTTGTGRTDLLPAEAIAFGGFTIVSFAAALVALRREP